MTDKILSSKDGESSLVEKSPDIDISLHDMNKTLVSQLPKMTKGKEAQMYREIDKWSKKNDFEYLAFFALENQNITIIRKLLPKVSIVTDLKELIDERGELQDYHFNKNTEAFEFWISGIFYALFDYSEGVVHVG